jgi:hypothetical protein
MADAMLSFTPAEAAGADRCPATGPVLISADWLRLARLARALSWGPC